MFLRHFTVFLGVLMGPEWAWAEDEDTVQAWNRVTIPSYETERIRFQTTAQIRARDAYHRLQRWEISERFRFRWYDHTSLGVGMALIQNDVPEEGDAPLEYRLFPSISHRVPLGESGLSLRLRNRVDFRWLEGEEDMSNRSRHRVGLHYAFEDMGILDYVYGHNEFYYDWREGGINQNRITPIGVGLKVHSNWTLDLFYTLRMDDRGSPWDRTHVIGTHIKLKF